MLQMVNRVDGLRMRLKELDEVHDEDGENDDVAEVNEWLN